MPLHAASLDYASRKGGLGVRRVVVFRTRAMQVEFQFHHVTLKHPSENRMLRQTEKPAWLLKISPYGKA